MSPANSRERVAIALVACAMLVTEVAITRVVSVVLQYHFAFASVSLAMLGMAVPGAWFAFAGHGEATLRRCLLTAALLLPASMVAVTRLAPALSSGQTVMGGWTGLAFYGACAALPFLALGASLCLLLARAPPGASGRYYAADLAGGVVGALLAVGLMDVLPTPHLIAACGLVVVVALWLVSPARWWPGVLVFACLGGLLAWSEPFRLRHTKSYVEHEAPIFEQWTSTGRITVLQRNPYTRFPLQTWGWGFGTRRVPLQRTIPELWMEQDGSAGTPVEPLADLETFRQEAPWDVTMVPHLLFHPRSACIIGVGGGRDVIAAHGFGVERILGIELNPAMPTAFATVLKGRAVDPFTLPGVEIIIGEGRSELMRETRSFDLIQLSLVDNAAASAAGGFALTESYLYTREALRMYLSRLTPDGVVALSRWGKGPQRLETPRLILMAYQVLVDLGVPHPERHLLLMGGNWVGTLMITRGELTVEQIQLAERVAEERGFDIHWPPTTAAAPQESWARDVMIHGTQEPERMGFDLSPAVDDQPFFFQSINVLAPPSAETLREMSFNEQAVDMLRKVLGLLCALCAVVVAFTPWVQRRLRSGHRAAWLATSYFAVLGVAFMLVEVPLIQRFILLLGHPSRAAGCVLASMLLGAGVGSAVVHQMTPARRWQLLALAPVLIVLLDRFSPLLAQHSMGWPWVARAVVSSVLVAVVSFPLGLGFPGGLAAFGEKWVPWAWAVNGAWGVLGSVLAIFLALVGGFSMALQAGAACYAAAVLLLMRASSQPAGS